MSNIRLVVLQDQVLALLDAVDSESDPVERLRLLHALGRLWEKEVQRRVDVSAYQATRTSNVPAVADASGWSLEKIRLAVQRYKDRNGIPRFVKKTVPTDLDFSARLRSAKALTSHPKA